MRKRALTGYLGILLSAFSESGSAYPLPLHERLPDVLLNEPFARSKAALPNDEGLNRFRLAFFRLAAATADPALRARFLRHYPTSASFTGQAFKEFLGMSAVHPALGFDSYGAVENATERDRYGPIHADQERAAIDWVRIGSLYPDLDQRDRDRWWVVDGRIERAQDGERIPYDPVILNMGRVEGLSGQAHAHYGLNRNPKSDDVNVLKTRPADFAIRAGFPPAPVLTFAPERAQAYGDLALIARYLREPALAALVCGNSFHYLADVANQIHTIQVGIYDFFVDSTLEAWKLKLLKLGGLLGPIMERNQIGIDIIGNHHSWSEAMFRIAFERSLAGKRLDPALSQVEDLFRTDPQLQGAWAALPAEGPLLRELADRIIVAGNAEGPEIYALVRTLTKSDLRRAGFKMDFGIQPDDVVLAYLAPRADPAKMTRFLELEQFGARRAATAMLFWWRVQFSRDRPQDIRAVMDRLLTQQLSELEAAEARRSLWIKMHGGIRHVTDAGDVPPRKSSLVGANSEK